MAVVNVKEIYKEFNLAKKHFKKAIELGKKNIMIGEIHFPVAEKKVRGRKAKKDQVTDTDKGLGDLPDLDRNNPFYNGKK